MVQDSFLSLAGLSIQHCIQESAIGGGAVLALNSNLALDGVILQFNRAGTGGAIYAASTSSSASLIHVRSSTFRHNSAQLGGGLFVSNANVTIVNSALSCNTGEDRTGDDIHCQSGSTIGIDFLR